MAKIAEPQWWHVTRCLSPAFLASVGPARIFKCWFLMCVCVLEPWLLVRFIPPR